MRVGFIGAGAIGLPMAMRLAPHHDLAVFDPDPERVAPLAERGARAASSAEDAARGAEVTVVMVATPAQLETAVFGAGGVAAGAAPGAVMIIMSSVGIAAAESCAERLAAYGLRVVDAPVTGGVARAAEGELTLLLAGDPASIEAARPVLERMGSHLAVCGDRVGAGQAVKLVNQLLCSVHIAVAGEALSLAESLGLDARAVLETLGSGAAASFMLGDRGPRMLEEDPPVRSAIDIFVKDTGLVREAAAASGADTPLLAAAAARFAAAREAGLGRSDDSAVIRTYRDARSARGSYIAGARSAKRE